MAEETPAKKRKRLRWIVLLLLLVAGVFWLNGPGLRWLAPRITSHFFEKAGISGTYRLEGSFTGGLVVRDVDLKSEGALARLTADRIQPVYRLGRLRHGEIDALYLDDLHVDLRLGVESEKEKSPFDPDKIARIIREIRGRVIPVEIDLRNISLTASKEEKTVASLAPSRIFHQRGVEEIVLSLGAVTLMEEHEIPEQEVEIVWRADEITLERLVLQPEFSVGNLEFRMAEAEPLSAEARINLLDAVFQFNSGADFETPGLDLMEGSLDATALADMLGVESTASARLTSLSLETAGVLPDPAAATGKLRVLLEDIAWQEITSPEFALDFTLGGESAELSARGMFHGSEVTVQSTSGITRGDAVFEIGETTGTLAIAELAPILRKLAEGNEALDAEAEIPASSVRGDFTLRMSENQPRSARAALRVIPHDPEKSGTLNLNGEWHSEAPAKAMFSTDGVNLTASYDIGKSVYDGTMALDDFDSSRIMPWLSIAKVKSEIRLAANATWRGGGNVAEGTHHGQLSLVNATASTPEKADILAAGTVDYDWPGSVETEDLHIESDRQSIRLDLKLADGLLELRKFLITDQETEIVEGAGTLPMPEDFSKWRETLANDTREMDLKIESRELPLARFKTWASALEAIDPRSTGLLHLSLTGTFSDPEVDLSVHLKDLRVPEQQNLPPTDLQLEIAGRDGRLSVKGAATAPDYPPARLEASMAFLPAKWAEEPGLVLQEEISAKVDLPRIELSRFISLVPALKSLQGVLTGNVVVSGKIGSPEPKGELVLTGGAASFKDRALPELSGLGLNVDFNMEAVTLRTLRGTMAGGTLQGEGKFSLSDKTMDLRLRGGHLPILRNDMLILRANADLRLQGPLETAGLTGSVNVVDSVFYQDIEILPIGVPFTAPAAADLPKIDAATASPTANLPEPFKNWTMNVLLRTADPVLIRGNLATGEVDVALRVGGTFGNPAPDGTVRLKRVTASLPFSTLTVREGTLTFTPAGGFDPVIELRGRAEPRPYQVNLYVYGRASDPQLVLTSVPPMPENEIMTLLATGTTTSGLEDPQAASARAMQLLAEEVRRGRVPFSRQLRPALGILDRVDFSLSEADPYSSDSFSTATLKLHNRWYLSAGMGEEGNTRVLGIWRLRFH